jgi:3-keto-5-aminohexanoate cleavage enzyme
MQAELKNKIMITVAVTGSRATKEMNAAVPYTPKEIIEAAIDSEKAGAAIVHVHVREQTGRPSLKIEYFREVLEGIRERSNMIVNLTTSPLWFEGKEEEVIEERLRRVYLKPDMCSFDLGSMNLPDQVAVSHPIRFGERAALCMREYGVKPEIEAFDLGHIHQATDLIKRGFIDAPPYFQLCMGTKWGVEASPENLIFMRSKLPSDSLWSVLGVGKDQLPMIATAMLIGGNVRVGFEDNIYLKKGVLASSNAEMVETAANLAERLGRTVANPAVARQMLGLGSAKKK